MLQVQVDPERLAKLDLTLDHVMETTSDALEVGLLRYSGGAHIGTGGFIDTPDKRLPDPSHPVQHDSGNARSGSRREA